MAHVFSQETTLMDLPSHRVSVRTRGWAIANMGGVSDGALAANGGARWCRGVCLDGGLGFVGLGLDEHATQKREVSICKMAWLSMLAQ